MRKYVFAVLLVTAATGAYLDLHDPVHSEQMPTQAAVEAGNITVGNATARFLVAGRPLLFSCM